MGSILCAGGSHLNNQAIRLLSKPKVTIGPTIKPEVGSRGSVNTSANYRLRLMVVTDVAAILMGDSRITEGMALNTEICQ
jgi:hypothetical protein